MPKLWRWQTECPEGFRQPSKDVRALRGGAGARGRVRVGCEWAAASVSHKGLVGETAAREHENAKMVEKFSQNVNNQIELLYKSGVSFKPNKIKT